MFTGIVTAIGTLRRAARSRNGMDLTIAAGYTGIEPGESIAVSGACLTVTSRGRGWFSVHAVKTTLERTRLGQLRKGDRVNLERAVRAGEPLGGHLVQGHVDGLGQVTAVKDAPDLRLIDVRIPESLAPLIIPLGSIAVEGVSLTVNARPAPDIIQVAIVPFTRAHTTLGEVARGDQVQLEGDLIAKYVRALLERGPGKGKAKRIHGVRHD